MQIRTLGEDDLEQAWELDRDAFHTLESRKQVLPGLHDPARLLDGF